MKKIYQKTKKTIVKKITNDEKENQKENVKKLPRTGF